MDVEKQAKAIRERKKLALRSMHFNRFLFVRYATALLFFVCLNWFFAFTFVQNAWIFVPLVFFSCSALAAFEQVKLFFKPSDDALLTVLGHKALLAGQSVLALSAFTPLFNHLFPFLIDSGHSRTIVAVFFAIGALLSLISLVKLARIRVRQDKHYQRIIAYQNSLNH